MFSAHWHGTVRSRPAVVRVRCCCRRSSPAVVIARRLVPHPAARRQRDGVHVWSTASGPGHGSATRPHAPGHVNCQDGPSGGYHLRQLERVARRPDVLPGPVAVSDRLQSCRTSSSVARTSRAASALPTCWTSCSIARFVQSHTTSTALPYGSVQLRRQVHVAPGLLEATRRGRSAARPSARVSVRVTRQNWRSGHVDPGYRCRDQRQDGAVRQRQSRAGRRGCRRSSRSVGPTPQRQPDRRVVGIPGPLDRQVEAGVARQDQVR